ncbi:STM4015 family protein [Actinocorallia sp. A-T 12471]|uniref:STM4015 family protein n=1 Tax=Actinocorallia sp. A-T 12471 TaxID=3089813 RepID=UPI0029CD572F|nr:STM4015 family protein [Actinocorallia sp. A-T 12471]MDX6739865.1 STM4015 family protein [Actinocorallia sp. A-T 12471]
MINQFAESFAGLPVFDFTEETELTGLPEPESVAWRLRIADYVEEFEPFQKLFASFLEHVDTARVGALLFGNWGPTYDVASNKPLGLLTDAAERFPNLRAFFFAEFLQEEAEISWIMHDDITPLFTTFGGLEEVVVRGGSGLSLEPLKAPSLKSLRFESGGLPGGVVRAVGASDFPALESLELWLGVEDYGGTSSVEDLAPILSGERLPALRELGLQNSAFQDRIAAAVAGAPIVARLEALSLSMGSLTDEGAEALLSGQPLGHLARLDLHHHYMSDAMMERIVKALPGVAVNVDDQNDPEDDWRYVEVAE